MPALNLFTLPLLPQPPLGYGWEARSTSELSTRTAFERGVDLRDTFLGARSCVICGSKTISVLEHCHIIMKSETDKWDDLRQRGWLPSQAKASPLHEPRNGLLMCSNHHHMFDGYDFFIRYVPEARKFVLFNHSGISDLVPYHGKAIALDITHHHAPFPQLFIIHEMRVRAHYPFQSTTEVSDALAWQDWISSSGVLRSDTTSGFFNRESAPSPPHPPSSVQPQQQQFSTQTGGMFSQGIVLGLDDDVIAKILAASRASPSWKACQIEGTSWAGTAEENRRKYISLFGAEDSS